MLWLRGSCFLSRLTYISQFYHLSGQPAHTIRRFLRWHGSSLISNSNSSPNSFLASVVFITWLSIAPHAFRAAYRRKPKKLFRDIHQRLTSVSWSHYSTL